MRGTAVLHQYGGNLPRITPACAGNRPRLIAREQNKKDHPRVCGEQYACRYRDSVWVGSPPRVRGTDLQSGFLPLERRITPACAGNSISCINHALAQKDHPRVCGEQPQSGCLAAQRLGSPPRVRGTAYGCNFSGVQGRITPACAGNRRPPGHRSGGYRDHPRVCGEQSFASA